MNQYPNSRPIPSERNFESEVINKFVDEIAEKISDKDISTIFSNCYPNTLDTTVEYDEKNNDTFIITGDIKAMWLRDSSFQIYPYLIHCKKDAKLNHMILSLFNRQLSCILLDPYANAFNKDEFESPWFNDKTFRRKRGELIPAMNKYIWERKFELDSLMCPFFVMYKYYENTGCFSFINEKWFNALKIVIDVIKKERRSNDEEDLTGGEEYNFQRCGYEPFDSQHQGRGNPCKSCGLIKCNFRNSDDATLFPFNIPENALISATFFLLEKMLNNVLDNNNCIKKCWIKELNSLATEIKESIYKHGVITDIKTKEKFFAFEVDGFGNYYFMDEPGYPSLISLPFFEFIDKEDEIYINTRKRILSERNPYYIKGKCGNGVASSHSWRRYIWPLFTIMQGITSTSKEEVYQCLKLLVKSAEGTGFIHESFDVDDPSKYTRDWFAWANSFFGVFILKILDNNYII